MDTKKEEQVQELLKKSEISLWIDNYDDIFSDFDPRPYSQRAVSDDFITEAKKAAREKGEGIELKFLVPHDLRDAQTETMVRKRLKEHFKKRFIEKTEKKKKLIKKGLYFAFSGLVLMFLASLVILKLADTSLVTSFLIVLLEPAGWFLFWEGLNLVIFDVEEKIPDIEFYDKMNKAEISFIDF